MPVMDGFAVVRRLREVSPWTPVIVVTDTGDSVARSEVSRMGAWRVLNKPIDDLGLLENTIIEALFRAERCNGLSTEVCL
jgi:DNA-binding response OmpR family regulator